MNKVNIDTVVAEALEAYRTTYTNEWERVRGTSSIRLVLHANQLDDNSPIVKVYENEGNFFLCGFNWISFSGRDRKLRDALQRAGCRIHKGYPTGLDAVLPSFSLHGHGTGNGDFTIQEVAYHAAARVLQANGFAVSAQSRLD